jgi:hypothetical protein
MDRHLANKRKQLHYQGQQAGDLDSFCGFNFVVGCWPFIPAVDGPSRLGRASSFLPKIAVSKASAERRLSIGAQNAEVAQCEVLQVGFGLPKQR